MASRNTNPEPSVVELLGRILARMEASDARIAALETGTPDAAPVPTVARAAKSAPKAEAKLPETAEINGIMGQWPSHKYADGRLPAPVKRVQAAARKGIDGLVEYVDGLRAYWVDEVNNPAGFESSKARKLACAYIDALTGKAPASPTRTRKATAAKASKAPAKGKRSRKA